MIDTKNFDGDVSVGRNAAIGGDAKIVGGVTVGRNLKVEGWLDAKNIKGANKGVFLNEESLKKAYPIPQDGWWALVGETMPAALWVAYGGEWSNTGGTGGEITVESQQVAEAIARFEEEMQSVRDVNELQTNNIVSLQSKGISHDERIFALEAKDIEHNDAIAAIQGKDATQDGKIEKLEERVLQYLYPKIYQLNEGAGARVFHGFTKENGEGGLNLTKDTYRYSVLYSTTQKQFVLNVTDEASGVTVLYSSWPKISLPNNKNIASSESYAQRDCLYYIFVDGEGSTYYYIDSNGEATEKSATYLLRKLIDDLSTNLDTANASLNAKDAEQDRTIGAIQAKNTEQDGVIGSLEEKNDEQDTRIAALLQDTPWERYHMNAFTETGEYRIHGDRTNANDGLPIINEGSGHTIEARLTVLDSSLTNGTGEKTDIVVTQILRLSNRTGGDGHVYVRTGQAKNKSQLATPSSTAWGTWEKLMGIFEKNAVSNATDLNEYTSSGMYDGMFVFSPKSQTAVSGLKIENGSTFLMVAVNGYAVAQTGVVPQVTQLLYVMPSGLDGSSGVRNAKLYTRTGIYVASTKTYTWGKFDGLAQASDITKLLGYIQENSDLIQENQSAITANTKEIARVNSTATRAQEDAKRAQDAADKAQTAAQEAKDSADTKITELAGKVNEKQDALTLTVKDNGNIVLANIQGQSKEFMPATPSGDPMHYAYVTAGAEYNDTGSDIVKDAPWADLADDDADKTVIHKAGYWYLNGLGDITNEQMQRIYMLTGSNQNYWDRYCNGQDVRTNILTIRDIEEAPTNVMSVFGGLRRCSIEVLKVWTHASYKDVSVPYFNLIYVEKLKFIIGVFKASNKMLGSSIGNLKGIKIFGIYTSATFSDAKKLSIKSVLYMINNEAATSPITITLHADVYNRCMANEDILAALEAHTNISIASA